MANNANIRAINDNMANANAELQKALVATQQQVAALARAMNTSAPAQQPQPAWGHNVNAPQAYTAAAAGPTGWNNSLPAPPPPPPQLQQPPNAYQTYGAPMGGGRGRGRGRGRGGRGRGGRNRRGGVGFQPNPPTYNNYPAQPPPPGGVGGGRGGNSTPNLYKRWNNWNACYSCGFDVPKWHTSATCPWECRKEHHQEGYTRKDYDQYVQAGWNPSKVGKHKKYLPIPGTEMGK